MMYSCAPEDGTKKGEVNNDMFGESDNSKPNDNSAAEITITQDLHIKITPFVPSFEGLGESSLRLLKDRINSAVTKGGFGGDGSNPRYVIGPSIVLVSENITSTAPTKFANTYEVTLMVVDVVTETVFNSYKKEFKGVGDSPEKAFISGFKNVHLEDQVFYDFLKKSEDKIIAYFKSHCNEFMQEAEGEAGMRNFDNAYAILSNIPVEASSCFEQVTVKKLEYFQASLNIRCNELLSSMRAEMGKFSDASASGFNTEAMTYYALIDKQSECYDDAQKAYQAYIKKLKPDQKRDWDFKLKQYEDNMANIMRQQEFEEQKAKDLKEMEFRMAELQANTEIQGNKRLLAKYKHDESPWLVRMFSSFTKWGKGELDTD